MFTVKLIFHTRFAFLRQKNRFTLTQTLACPHAQCTAQAHTPCLYSTCFHTRYLYLSVSSEHKYTRTPAHAHFVYAVPGGVHDTRQTCIIILIKFMYELHTCEIQKQHTKRPLLPPLASRTDEQLDDSHLGSSFQSNRILHSMQPAPIPDKRAISRRARERGRERAGDCVREKGVSRRRRAIEKEQEKEGEREEERKRDWAKNKTKVFVFVILVLPSIDFTVIRQRRAAEPFAATAIAAYTKTPKTQRDKIAERRKKNT